MSEIFDDRRRSLEEAFFAKQNAKLLEKMRQQAGIKATKSSLAEASGIRDDRVLTELVKLGLEEETLAALSLVPLIEVAWADGSVTPEERVAVLSAARDRGIKSNKPAFKLLENWLRSKPEPKLLDVWKDYVQALSDSLSPSARHRLREEVLTCARQVADSSGGFWGLGKRVSEAEELILGELESAFI